MNLERVRSHPARYLVPNALTVARPILGHKAFQAAKVGNWSRMEKFFLPALMTDMEGTPARALNATSTFGSIADPIADAILRAQALRALAPNLGTVTKSVVLGGELLNLGLNSQIQEAKGRPKVPFGAKAGSFAQAVGAGLVVEGLRKKQSRMRVACEAVIVAGTALRVGTYYSLYRKERKGLPWYAKHPRHSTSQTSSTIRRLQRNVHPSI